MPIGSGKYNELCTQIREEQNASAVVVLVVNGNKGSGVAVQCKPGYSMAVANALQAMIDKMKADIDAAEFVTLKS